MTSNNPVHIYPKVKIVEYKPLGLAWFIKDSKRFQYSYAGNTKLYLSYRSKIKLLMNTEQVYDSCDKDFINILWKDSGMYLAIPREIVKNEREFPNRRELCNDCDSLEPELYCGDCLLL